MDDSWWIATEKALRQGEWKLALQQLERCSPSARDQKEYWKLLCCAYLQAGSWSAVSSISASAAQRYSQEPVFWECWAWAEHIEGRTADAVQILEPASARFHDRESIAYALACLYASLNRLSEAARYLKRAEKLSADPNSFALKAASQKELKPLLTSRQIYLSE